MSSLAAFTPKNTQHPEKPSYGDMASGYVVHHINQNEKLWFILGGCSSDTWWCMDDEANHDIFDVKDLKIVNNDAEFGYIKIANVLFRHIFTNDYFKLCMKSNIGLSNFSSSLWWLAMFCEDKHTELSIWFYAAAARANPAKYGWVMNTLQADIQNNSHANFDSKKHLFLEDVSELSETGVVGHCKDALDRCHFLVTDSWTGKDFNLKNQCKNTN